MCVHEIVMDITHYLDVTLTPQYEKSWFDSGDVEAQSFGMPIIPPSTKAQVKLCSFSPYTGTSGYIIYSFPTSKGTGYLAIAASNPAFGTNKLDIAVVSPTNIAGESKSLWDNMENHGYNKFDRDFVIAGKKVNAQCRCAGGSPSKCSIVLSYLSPLI